MKTPRIMLLLFLGPFLLNGGVTSATPKHYVLLPSGNVTAEIPDVTMTAEIEAVPIFRFSEYGKKFTADSPALGPIDWAEAKLLVKLLHEEGQADASLWEHHPKTGEEVSLPGGVYRLFHDPEAFEDRMSWTEAEIFQTRLSQHEMPKEAHKGLAFDTDVPANVRNRALVLHAYDLLAGNTDPAEVVRLLTPLADGKVVANGLDVAEARFILGKIAHYRHGDRLRGYKYYDEA